MNELKLHDRRMNMNVRSTIFDDGMVVTAEDLRIAMHYPVELLQTLVRGYFGCGVVCGLGVKPESEKDPTYCVKIEPGVALDCHGHPLQLCEAEKIDLTPDPCVRQWPKRVCIAIRRDTLSEVARDDDETCGGGKSQAKYRREREGVRIKVFPDHSDSLPKTLCKRNEPPLQGFPTQEQECKCIKACSECACCGEAWVLLACVDLDREKCTVKVDESARKYVRPIECHCHALRQEMYESSDINDERRIEIREMVADEQTADIDEAPSKAGKEEAAKKKTVTKKGAAKKAPVDKREKS